jgi:hypothetical protein
LGQAGKIGATNLKPSSMFFILRKAFMVYENNSRQKSNSEQSQLIAKIKTGLELLAEPDQVVELRVLEVDGKPCTASGYFDDFDKLAAWAVRYDGM